MVNRRSNLLTSRFGYFGTWNSRWVGENTTYGDLVHQDFKIVSFLNGLFRKLTLPTGKFLISRGSSRIVVIETDLYIIRPFWIVYSHIDEVMESSFAYYVSRLFFKMPLLLLYSNDLKVRNLKKRYSRKFKKFSYFTIFSRRNGVYRRNIGVRSKRAFFSRNIFFMRRGTFMGMAIFCILKLYFVRFAKNNFVLNGISSLKKQTLVHKILRLFLLLCSLKTKWLLRFLYLFRIFRKKKNRRKSTCVSLFLSRKKRFLSISERFYIRSRLTNSLFFFIRFFLLRHRFFVKRLYRASKSVFNSFCDWYIKIRYLLFRFCVLFFGPKHKLSYLRYSRIFFTRTRFFLRHFCTIKLSRRFIYKFLSFVRVFSSLFRYLILDFKSSPFNIFLKRKYLTYSFLVQHFSSISYITSLSIACSLLYFSRVSYLLLCFSPFLVTKVSLFVGALLNKIVPYVVRWRYFIRFLLRVKSQWYYKMYYLFIVKVLGTLIFFTRGIILSNAIRAPSNVLYFFDNSLNSIFFKYGNSYFYENGLVLLNCFLSLKLFDIRASLISRRLFVYTYFKKFYDIRDLRQLLWVLKNSYISFHIGQYKRKRLVKFISMQQLNFFSRRVFYKFSSSRTSNYIKNFLRTTKKMNRVVHSFFVIFLWRLSLDKLIQNIEHTLSEYLHLSVLFFPRIYVERLRNKFWLHNAVKETLQRVKKTKFKINRFKKVFISRHSMHKKPNPSKKSNQPNKSNKLKKLNQFKKPNQPNKQFFIRKARISARKKKRKFLLKKRFIRGFTITNKLKKKIMKYKKVFISGWRHPVALRKYILITNKIKLRKKLRRLRKIFYNKSSEFAEKKKHILNRKYSPIRKYYFLFRRRKIIRAMFLRKVKYRGPQIRSKFPPIKEAKLLCDYIVYYLNNRVRVYRLFSNLRYWQKIEYRITNTLKYNTWIDSDVIVKKYPLCGIRISCVGSPKKGGRTRIHYYHLWIRNQRLTREMPLQRIEIDIDYFASNTHVTTGTVGVKVWLCFSTISYRYRSRNDTYYV